MSARRLSVTGQSLIEFTVLVIAVVAALVFMMPYARSAIMHRMKSGASGFGQGMLFR